MRHRPLRARRGNYAVLFVLTAAIMLSYLAFSIDGGRMKVAKVQAENASEAATLAALVTIREGGDQGDAEAAALLAASKVSVMGSSDDASGRFDITVDWGRWDWNRSPEGDDLGAQWDAANGSEQAVTVRVQVNGGISSIFAPAIAIVSGGGGQPSRKGGPPEEEAVGRFDQVQISATSRSAFRHRDTIVLVDVSRENEDDLDAVTDALQVFIADLEDNDVPGDRISVMAYAGSNWIYDLTDTTGYEWTGDDLDASIGAFEPANPFFRVDQTSDSARQVMDVVEPCYVGSDAWFRWYRHMPVNADAELALYPTFGGNWEYWLVGAPEDANPAIDDRFRLDVNDPAHGYYLWLLNRWATAVINPCPHAMAEDPYTLTMVCPYFTELAGNNAPLTDAEQCNAWMASETMFLTFDARRSRPQATGLRSPVNCHDDHWYEGRAERMFNANQVNAVNCGYPGSAEFIEPGLPRYGLPADDRYYPDKSYTMAGSRPGLALDRAFQLLQNRLNRSAEPNIVLITGSGPNCGRSMAGDVFEELCRSDLVDEAVDAVQAIEANEMNLYVLGLLPAGTPEEAVLSNWDDVGRGWYVNLTDASLVPELADIASDMKIQVVQ